MPPPSLSDTPGVSVAGDGAVAMTTEFTDFHAAHRDRLVRCLALHLGDTDLAADAVDHAMAKAWRRWGRLDEPGAWVYRVALNRATSWLRRARFRSNRPVPELHVHDPEPSGDARLARALDRLPSPFRAVVVLRLVADMSVDDVAVALDIPPGTVKSRLSRGIDRLRTTLADGKEQS